MIAKDTNLGITTVDIDRPGPHYTVDSMRLLHQTYPHATLVYLMGADSLQSLYKVWYKADEFVDLCDQIGVMKRPGHPIKYKRARSSLSRYHPKDSFD